MTPFPPRWGRKRINNRAHIESGLTGGKTGDGGSAARKSPGRVSSGEVGELHCQVCGGGRRAVCLECCSEDVSLVRLQSQTCEPSECL